MTLENMPNGTKAHNEKRMMTYALDQNDRLVHVDSVSNGLKCDCHCPACGQRLSARQGTKKSHSFAHYSDNEVKCAYGYQTSLHLLAKEIISEGCDILLPPVFYDKKAFVFSKFDSEDYRAIKEPIHEPYKLRADSVELEKKFDSFIPDIILHYKGKPLIVEIFVTHPVDDEKQERIRAAGVSAIEFDLSDVDREIYKESLRAIFESGENCHWVFNALGVVKAKEYMEIVEKKHQQRLLEEKKRREEKERIRQRLIEERGGYFQYYKVNYVGYTNGEYIPFIDEPPCVDTSIVDPWMARRSVRTCIDCPFFIKVEPVQDGNVFGSLKRLLCQCQRIHLPNPKRNITSEEDMERWIQDFYYTHTEKVSRDKSKNEELVRNLIEHAKLVARLSGHEELCDSIIPTFSISLVENEYKRLVQRIRMKLPRPRF